MRQISPVLRAIGDKLIYCGPPGSGMVCKICNNLVTMSLAAFLPEALTLGVEAGVDLRTVAKAITSGSGNNWVLEGKFPTTLFQGNFEPGFSLNLASKDVHLATELGRELGLPMEASNLFAQTYRAALRQGLGRLDADAVALSIREAHRHQAADRRRLTFRLHKLAGLQQEDGRLRQVFVAEQVHVRGGNNGLTVGQHPLQHLATPTFVQLRKDVIQQH